MPVILSIADSGFAISVVVYFRFCQFWYRILSFCVLFVAPMVLIVISERKIFDTCEENKDSVV